MVYQRLKIFVIVLFVSIVSTSFAYFSVSSKYVVMPFDDYSLLFSVSNENVFGLFSFRNIYNFEIINENKENLGSVNLYYSSLSLVYRNWLGLDRFIYIVGAKVNYDFYYYFSDVKFGGILGGGYRFSNDYVISILTYLLPYGNSILVDFSYTLFKDYTYLFVSTSVSEVSKEFFSDLKTKVFSFDSYSKKFEFWFLFGLGFSSTKGVLPSLGAILNYDWLSISYVGRFQDVVGVFHEFGVELKRW
jgi:hypothetical protein